MVIGGWNNLLQFVLEPIKNSLIFQSKRLISINVTDRTLIDSLAESVPRPANGSYFNQLSKAYAITGNCFSWFTHFKSLFFQKTN